MEISFCSHPNNNIVIATIFGTWHDSWAFVACAKFCCDMITSNWIKAKWNFHRIWIVMEKLLVKWVPGTAVNSEVFHLSISQSLNIRYTGNAYVMSFDAFEVHKSRLKTCLDIGAVLKLKHLQLLLWHEEWICLTKAVVISSEIGFLHHVQTVFL